MYINERTSEKILRDHRTVQRNSSQKRRRTQLKNVESNGSAQLNCQLGQKANQLRKVTKIVKEKPNHGAFRRCL